MQHISPLVFSATGLVDPAMTALISWVFGVEPLPAWFSWLGGGVVIAGVVVISHGEKLREEEEEKAKEALKQSMDTEDEEEEFVSQVIISPSQSKGLSPSLSRRKQVVVTASNPLGGGIEMKHLSISSNNDQSFSLTDEEAEFESLLTQS